jgi:hypothetical protein
VKETFLEGNPTFGITHHFEREAFNAAVEWELLGGGKIDRIFGRISCVMGVTHNDNYSPAKEAIPDKRGSLVNLMSGLMRSVAVTPPALHQKEATSETADTRRQASGDVHHRVTYALKIYHKAALVRMMKSQPHRLEELCRSMNILFELNKVATASGERSTLCIVDSYGTLG